MKPLKSGVQCLDLNVPDIQFCQEISGVFVPVFCLEIQVYFMKSSVAVESCEP